MPDTVTMQLDAVDALAAQLADLGAELATDADGARVDGARLGQALSGPAAAELTTTGQGWAGLVESLAHRTGSLATTLAQAVASYRALDELITERVGAGWHAPVAR